MLACCVIKQLCSKLTSLAATITLLTNMLLCSPRTVIDATRTGNDARYINHSHEANCQCQKWVVDDQPRAFMVALSDIAPGEELTYNSYQQCSLGEQVRSVLCLSASVSVRTSLSSSIQKAHHHCHWHHVAVSTVSASAWFGIVQ